ncbi:kinesin-like protein KIF22 [Corticium candelabrum]|uniref:kinesin-like protein KIF22 n=1 Tax=Corticium candelabrum TaxID=121492 RepID=UPI002E271BDD|nr:kinesin-like protein KIF22 [Corticium candelabrum]
MNCTIHFSAIEIYNEKVYDLLSCNKEDLPLYDTANSVTLKGLTEIELCDEEHFYSFAISVIQKRHTASTKCNNSSSRGHALLQFKVVSQHHKTTGKLVIADLAGNENNTKTGNAGARMRESKKINSSLFAFSLVLAAVNNKQKSIPYRNSKLTRLLKDSIGGSSLSTIIATIDPSVRSYQSTHQTLVFSSKASKVVNNVVVHPVTPHRLPPRQVIEEHEPMHETVDLNLTTGIKMSEFMNDTDIMTPSPKRVSYCKTPSHDLPPGFSPFVRTIMGRLERIEDKLDEQCLSMSQLNQTTGNALMNLQSTSPAAEQIIDLTTTEQSLSTNTEQAAVHTSLVQRPFYSVPFLADKKPKFRPLKRFRPMGEPVDQRSTTYSQPSVTRLAEDKLLCWESLQLINTGTLTQLCELPGIGNKRAQNIIMYRPFVRVEDLANVPCFPTSIIQHLLSRP